MRGPLDTAELDFVGRLRRAHGHRELHLEQAAFLAPVGCAKEIQPRRECRKRDALTQPAAVADLVLHFDHGAQRAGFDQAEAGRGADQLEFFRVIHLDVPRIPVQR